MKQFFNLFDLTQKVNYKNEILSGLTVAIALVPEAIAFALLAGLSPITGLYAAFSIGLITSILGGRPGMISGATGAIAVIFIGMIVEFKEIGITGDEIVQYIFATVVLAGILQMLVGILRLGKFIRLVPHSVMYGFVNGLAIVIFTSQLASFQNKSADGTMEWMTGNSLYLMLGLVLLTMLIIWGLPKLTKLVPSSLVAIIVISVITIGFGIDTSTVKDTLDGGTIAAGFPPFNIPQIPYTWETLWLILPYAVIVAGVGLIESLLTLNLIDEITKTRGRSNKECIAQGAANTVTGFFSGMGGCAMLGQSLINISSGARARLSGIVASIGLLVFIMFGSGVIEQLPMAALTGVMIMVSIGTFEWASLRTFNKMPITDIIVMLTVMLITVVFHNLALAVLVGVIISALSFAWQNATRIRARKHVDEYGVKYYEIYGPLFFGSIAAFNDKFNIENDPDEIVIDFKESRVTDMSGIEALNKLTELYQNEGKTVHLKHLSEDCRQLLKNAEKIIEVNVIEDPTYKVMSDKLS
jgi:SulP family sulfate permease